MGNLMHHRNYEMSLEELAALLDVSERSGYQFEFILTGGEPVIWRNLKPGLGMLRRSPVAKRIRVFSNAVNVHNVDDEVMRNLDEFRISKYQMNQRNIDALTRRYPKKVKVVGRTEFYPNPSEPVDGVLPAKCMNHHQHLYFDYRVYGCPHSESIALGHGIEGARLFTPLAVGFLDELERIFLEQQPHVCTLCISNKNVRDKLHKVKNVNNYTKLSLKGKSL